MLSELILKMAKDYQELHTSEIHLIPDNDDIEIQNKSINTAQLARENFFDANLWYDVPLTPNGTPIVYPTSYIPENIINFVERNKVASPQNYCVEMFVDDRRFSRIWKSFDKLLPELLKFQGMCGPDVSNYLDIPPTISDALNTLGKLLTAKLQQKGVRVIPTVSWRQPQSYSRSFDGIPHNSVLAISNNGVLGNVLSRHYFIEGAHALIEMRTPIMLLVIGSEMDELKDITNIRYYPGYSQKLNKGGLYGRSR